MRWSSMSAAIAALSLISGTASARPRTPAAAAPVDDGDFWRDLLEPHSTAVASILVRARRALGKAATTLPDAVDGVERQQRFLGDAYGMLCYARTLAPDSPEVLRLLGTTADELGKTRQAIDALERAAQLDGPERAGPEVTGRLGMIYLRLGELDTAIRWLGHAQGALVLADHAAPTIYLATALAARGEMPAALDVLSNALPARLSYFTDPFTLVSFALAVHYDRDDQPAAAFEVLDRMQGALQQELAPTVQRALAGLAFAPAEDQYYYLAMLYETTGEFTEARAEWALYAAVTAAPWRRRALEHIQAIDAQRRTRPPGPPAPAAAASQPLPVP